MALLLSACGGGTPEPNPDDWRAMLRVGDGVGAEVALRKELDAGGNPADLAPFLGEAEMQQGYLADAEHWLTGGTFSPAVAAHGHHMLGRLRMRQGNLPAAGKAFDKAFVGARDNPELWVDIGRLRWLGGEQLQAIDAAERAIELGPESAAALLFSAQLLRDSAGNAAAVRLLERGLAVAPDDAELLGEYAATLGELGRAKDMLVAVRRLAQIAPGNRRVPWLQAVLAARAGENDLARSLLQRGGHLDREMPAAILLLALIDLDNGNYASAAQGLDRLLRMQPDNARIAALLARALSLGGNHHELVSRFASRADMPYFALLVGRAHEALGERERAAAYLDRAAKGGQMRLVVLPATTYVDVAKLRGTGQGADVVALVRGMLAAGQTAEASARSAAFLAKHPGSADAATLTGDAMLAGGNAHEALRYYRSAASVRRPWTLTKRMVAALDLAGDAAGGTRAVAEHLAGEPANADAFAMLARRLFDDGDRAGAARLAARAKAAGRNDPVLDRIVDGR